MGRKTYTIKQELVARFADALGNPARVAIVEYLGKVGSSYFGPIEAMLPLSKATVSQHLTVLKDAGLVVGEPCPPRVRYSIDKENWLLAKEVIGQFMELCINGSLQLEEERKTAKETAATIVKEQSAN